MMYLDSCIIIKLLVTEQDSAYFQKQLLGSRLSSSEIALTEVWSTLLRKEQRSEITKIQREKAWDVFQDKMHARQIRLHPLESGVLKKANHILESCHAKVPLRTLDAIHTAACDLSQDFPLCTTDRRMRDAARMLKIPVFPVEDAD